MDKRIGQLSLSKFADLYAENLAIADFFHYPDQSTFGKFFKKQTGISPSDYRTLSVN